MLGLRMGLGMGMGLGLRLDPLLGLATVLLHPVVVLQS
jgi:hypothetical protein